MDEKRNFVFVDEDSDSITVYDALDTFEPQEFELGLNGRERMRWRAEQFAVKKAGELVCAWGTNY